MKISRKLTKFKIISIILVQIIIYLNFLCFNNSTYAISQNRDVVIKSVSDLNKIDDAKYPGYKELLKNLLEIHPNWTFTILKTDLEWTQVLKNETTVRHSRNLVPSSKKGEWLCATCGSKIYDSGGWCCASEKAVAYYMDPRNFLNEGDIFQFETLSYAEGLQTIEGVKKIIKGTFMEGDKITYINTEGQTVTLDKSYAQVIMEAGKESNVSPYHIASRIKQEQGTGSASSTGKGQVEGYIGYYNIFNVNASGNGSGTIIQNAMSYAKDKGWDTPEKAIKGGAEFLAKSYISVGQNTIYLQKFDVDNSDGGLYYHQYMQNVLGALNEGKTVYSSYKDMGMLDTNINFVIPVYENMPKEKSEIPQENIICTENVKVKGTYVNVRQAASTSATIIAEVNTDDILLRIEKATNTYAGIYWDKVVLPDGSIGYISRDYIEKIDDVTNCNETAYTIGTGVNLRNGPGTTGTTVVTTLSINQSMTIIEKDKYNKDGYNWYRVKLSDGRQGYIASQYVSDSNQNIGEEVKVKADGGLILRNSPGTASATITIIPNGTVLTRLEKGTTSITGYYWDKVITSDGIQGYVATNYLVPVNDSNENNTSSNYTGPKSEIKEDQKQIKTEPDVKLENIKEQYGNKEITAVDINGKTITDTDLIGTGAKIKIDNKEYTVIKVGDTNGDGDITATDYVKIKNHIMKTSTLSEVLKLGADTNGDGDITATDYVKVKNHIMKNSSITL